MMSLLQPRLIDASGAEPGLVVDLRDEKRALLFDLAELGRLAPRVLLRLSHVFVTHTHMDHFAGFDRLLAVALGRVGRIVLWGGPGFVDQVEHKLRAYTWNVVHRYELPLTLEVHEATPEGGRRSAEFASPSAFARAAESQAQVDGDVLHEEALWRVRGRFVDHEMPVLAFALEEKARVRVAPDRLRAMGLTSGPWLRELKQAILAGRPGATPLAIRWRDREGDHAAEHTLAELSPLVLDVVDGRRIGYVTDMRFTEANVAALEALLAGVDLLYIESTFLLEDAAHARRKNHLTAAWAGEIARRVGAREIVPFHFSPRYEGRFEALVQEARASWQQR